MTEVRFDSGFYDQVVQDFGYEGFSISPFDSGLGNQTTEDLSIRYLCQSQLHLYQAAANGNRRVTTGFGMSGPPHLGTICQMLGILRLQESGESCQVVLGDLDAYNGKNKPLKEARDLASRYGNYFTSLGIEPDRLTVRSQIANPQVLNDMYLLAHFVATADLDDIEEDNHGHYVAHGIVAKEMTLARQMSLLLMVADFANLSRDTEATLVQLGIDEHRYVRFASELFQRARGTHPFPEIGTISAIYTRMIPGFNGHPKMSKSLPGSAIDVSSSPDMIRDLIIHDEERDPTRSPSFQIACQLPVFSSAEIQTFEMHCLEGGSDWRLIKSATSAYVAEVLSLWR